VYRHDRTVCEKSVDEVGLSHETQDDVWSFSSQYTPELEEAFYETDGSCEDGTSIDRPVERNDSPLVGVREFLLEYNKHEIIRTEAAGEIGSDSFSSTAGQVRHQQHDSHVADGRMSLSAWIEYSSSGTGVAKG
jgi:hypothetical protein